MRLIVKRDALARELDLLRSLFSGDTVICPDVDLSAENGRFTVCGTDKWTWLTAGDEATVVSPGKVTVHGERFLSLVKILPRADITLDANEPGTLALSAADFTAKLVCPTSSRVGQTPTDSSIKTAKISTDHLLSLIDFTSYIMNDEIVDSRVAQLSIAAAGERMVVTDRIRLAIRETGDFSGEHDKLLLPKKAIAHLKAMMANVKNVEFRYSPSRPDIIVVAGARTMHSRQIQTTYPSYERLLPTVQPVSTLTASAVAMASALRRTLLLLKHPEMSVVTFTRCDGGVYVQSDGSKEEGSSMEILECEVGEAFPAEMRMRANLLLRVIDNFKSERVVIEDYGQETVRPVIVRPEGGEGMVVVMPIAKPRAKAAA